MDTDGPQEYEVESITRARVQDKKGKKITWGFYVKWKGYDWDECTWEPAESFTEGSEHLLEAFWERIETGGRVISDASAFRKGEELLISGPPVRKSLKRKASSAKIRATSPEEVPSSNSATVSAPPGRKSLKRKASSAKIRATSPEDIPSSNGAAVSAPPGRKSLKRKASSTKIRATSPSEDVPSSNGPAISAPPLSPRKRRRLQQTANDERGYMELKSSVSKRLSKNGKISTRSPKQKSASSPGPRKSAPKRLPSVGDSQLDADGETDPDVAEVEDELMQVSAVDAEEDTTRTRFPATSSGIANGSKKVAFDDLEPFYSGNPIDIDQNTDEQVTSQTPGARLPPSSTSLLAGDTDDQASASPIVGSYDPLFDSPPHPSGKAPEIQRDPILPPHRARAAKPRVKLIETTTSESMGKQSRITAKARLMSGNVAKRGGKPGPGRSSSGLLTKQRNSLLTSAKGTLKTVMGKFASTTEHDQPDEIEEFAVDQGGPASDPQPCPPSGDELLRLAGLQIDPEPLPDYEDEPAAQPQEVGETQINVAPVPAEGQPDESSVKITESKANDHVADTPPAPEAGQRVSAPAIDNPPISEAGQQALTPAIDNHPIPETGQQASTPAIDNPSISEAGQQTSAPATDNPSISEAGKQVSTPVVDNPSAPPAVAPPDEAVKKNIELAKEHLFPSTQASFDSFSTGQSSFRSTIFGPLYQGTATNSVPGTKDELSATFKVIFGDGVELPLVLKDCSEIKARISDITIGNSSGKVALFYSAEDALAMVSTLKNDGTARVVLDPSVEATEQERFATLLQRFQASQTLIAPVGKEVCVLYSSENTGIAEKLGVPARLRGLANTLLISHASIENQLAYVGAIMKATAL